MGHPEPLPIWDRAQGKMVEEWMDDSPDTYETMPLQSFSQRLRSRLLYAALMGLLQRTPYSKRHIEPFLRKYQIDMNEFEARDYTSYNDFFVRRFRPGVRSFPVSPEELGAFAEALGWEKFTQEHQFPVKGRSLNAEQLLGGADLARPFLDGPLLVARLSPVDYHHVHYPDAGHTCNATRRGIASGPSIGKPCKTKATCTLKTSGKSRS